MKVKVCGITAVAQANEIAALGGAYVGFIFYKKSPRYVLDKMTKEDFAAIDKSIKKVGVFVNEDLQTVLKHIEDYDLQAVQLHGDETPQFCEALKEKTTIIKVVRINDTTDIYEATGKYKNVVDFFLFDTDVAAYGGSGKQFNWEILADKNIPKPYLLSGGISEDDVAGILAFNQKNKNTNFIGVDVNSRFETAPGVKDLNKIKSFIQSF